MKKVTILFLLFFFLFADMTPIIKMIKEIFSYEFIDSVISMLPLLFIIGAILILLNELCRKITKDEVKDFEEELLKFEKEAEDYEKEAYP